MFAAGELAFIVMSDAGKGRHLALVRRKLARSEKEVYGED